MPWTQTVLHTFNGGADGQQPTAALAIDTKGTGHSTTRDGGSVGVGTVYKIKL